ncbi:MAG: hypothetical protein GY754_24680 [bacterium]|nr:hypothetical protein [bacterium]
MDRKPFKRLLGQETEYAIRFTPAEGKIRPTNQSLYRLISNNIKELVKARPGERNYYQDQFFVENGGAFCYEFLPSTPEGGLLEGSTPECSSPSELLLYQRAQEELLRQAVQQTQSQVESDGTLGLIKNCRDAEGNIYGTQENYEGEIASGFSLFLYRAGLIFCFPFSVISQVVTSFVVLLTEFLLLIGAFVFYFFLAVIQGVLKLLSIFLPFTPMLFLVNIFSKSKNSLKNKFTQVIENEEEADKINNMLWRVYYKIFYPFQIPAFFPFILILWLTAFKKQRQGLQAFLISKPIISGAGTLLQDGTFALSEKGTGIRRLARVTISPSDRAIFDFGNILKKFNFAGIDLLLFRPSKYKQLFHRVQRIQLGLSDSNRAHIAEYLKTGTTLLMLEMAETGFLNDAPQLSSPVKALRAINSDPGLKTRVPIKGKEPMSGLEIQQYYLTAARLFLKQKKNISMEYYEIVKLWDETIKTLEKDPGKLIGRLDWVSKRYLIETSGADKSYEVKKKIDIAYHELNSGYFNLLEEKGIAPKLLDDSAIKEAIRTPSSPERVKLRSRLVGGIHYEGSRMTISWDSVRIGNWKNRKIVYLNKNNDQNTPKNKTFD